MQGEYDLIVVGGGAKTTYGVIGVKVWVYRGEILPTRRRESQREMAGAF